jgi:CGNR zinc finger/Glyoxalase-like domain
MAAFIKNLTVDCVDALRVARFWAAALGSDVDEDSTAERAYVEAAAWGGPNIWFRGGRGPKLAANRVHLDLRALTSMDEEVERLVGLGRRWRSASRTSPSCAIPRGTSSASSRARATPTHRRGGERSPGQPERRQQAEQAQGGGGQKPGVEPGHQVGDGRWAAGDLARARDLRDGLRAWLRARQGLDHDPERLGRARDLLGGLRLRVGLEARTAALRPTGGPVAAALERLAADLATAAATGTLQRLKVCGAPDCQFVYYDHSRSRTSRWCSTEVCGNRMKTRRYRDRRRG